MKRRQRTAHTRIWTVLGIALPLAFLAIMAMKQTVPSDRPAVRLAAPEGVAQ